MSAADDAVRALYTAHPDGFVAARTAAVAAARAAGDRAGARRLAALRRPTVAAWLVNLLAAYRPELIDVLVDLAGRLRAAQRGLDGDELRRLSQRRRATVAELVDAARGLAGERGARRDRLPLAEVEATLTAALAEPEVAARVRAGRLVRAEAYAGFGEVPRPRLRLVTADDAAGDTADGAADGAAGSGAGDPVAGRDGGPGEGQRREPGQREATRRAAQRRGARRQETRREEAGRDEAGRDEAGRDAAERATRERREQERREQERREQERREQERREQERREQERREQERRGQERELRRQLAAARAADTRARAALDRARGAERDAAGALERIEAELTELARRRADAQAAAAHRALDRRAAERAAAAARRRVGDVAAALDDLGAAP